MTNQFSNTPMLFFSFVSSIMPNLSLAKLATVAALTVAMYSIISNIPQRCPLEIIASLVAQDTGQKNLSMKMCFVGNLRQREQIASMMIALNSSEISLMKPRICFDRSTDASLPVYETKSINYGNTGQEYLPSTA
jgi:hypothetical protein